MLQPSLPLLHHLEPVGLQREVVGLVVPLGPVGQEEPVGLQGLVGQQVGLLEQEVQRWGDQVEPPAGRGSAVECEAAWLASAVVPCIVGEVPRLMDVSDVFDNLPDQCLVRLVHSAGAVGVPRGVALLVDQDVLHYLWYPKR